MEARPPAYLSPSRLTCYDRCPAEFQLRYIQKIQQPPSVERLFGVAVHAGLEAHFRGEDFELAFLRDWRKSVLECRTAGLPVSSILTDRGLELIDQVRKLNLTGQPERRICSVVAGISVPIFGFVDLWSDGMIYDFKTTGYGWTQASVDRQIFQPALYSQAYAEEHPDGALPRFEFVVLPRNGGQLQRLDGSRTQKQIAEVIMRAREIHENIEAGRFDCSCGEHVEPAA